MPSPKKKTATVEAIRPQYADAFRCIGPACEDTCCQGWNVFIDKQTYAKYQTIPDGPLRILVEQHVEPTGSADDFEHAKVKLHEDGLCPFLAEDRLCSIQKDHGESYLSIACAQYPRARKIVDGVEERTLLLSCPEAARLVLLDPRLVPVKKHGGSAGSRYSEFLTSVTGAPPHASTPLAYLQLVRTFTVLLLQDRSYPLWQRVFLLNLFCKRMNAFATAREWNRIPSLLSEHATIIANGSLRAALNSIPAQTTVQLAIIMSLVGDPSSPRWRNPRFAKCIADFSHAIGFRPGSSPADLVQNYIDAYDRYYRPWIA